MTARLAIRKGEISPELNSRCPNQSPPSCTKLGPENSCNLHDLVPGSEAQTVMTFPTRGWLCSLQWHVLPIGDRFVYGTGAGRPWPRVETMCRGRSAGHVCGNVDYCHHTELADAPAGRQVKKQAGSPVSRACLWKSWTEAKNVASPGSLGGWPKSSCGKDVRDVMGAGCKGPLWEGGSSLRRWPVG